MADSSVRFSASASQFVPPSDHEESILKMESKRFGKPKTDLHPSADVKYKETRSPLDRTRALPSALQPPGRHPRALEAGEGNPNAFNPGRVTQRKDPRSFLRAGQGFGGNTTSAVAAAVVDSRETEAKPKPPKAGAFEQRENPPNTELRRFYERGDLPCIIDQRSVHNKLAWKAKIESLDFHHFLPLFADGLRETEHPYKFLAREGISDLLEFGGNKILPVVPQLIIPLKNAFNTRNTEVVSFTCRVVQKLATCDVDIEGGPLVGQALVPYYRQLLPVLNLFHSKNRNLGDEIEYGQRKGENLGDLVQQTLNTLERYGGSDAYINIVYLVPTYESCMT